MSPTVKNALLLTLAVLALGLAGYRVFSSKPSLPKLPNQVTSNVVCANCRQECPVQHSFNDPGPFACPACGDKAAFKWLYCNVCHHRFVPRLVERDDGGWRPTPYPSCTHCGCTDVTLFDTENPDHNPEGDAELPKWPPR